MLSTHLVLDIAFGAYGTNEMLYAKTLLERIPDHSLTVFDKGFTAAEILLGLSQAGEQRHFLIPAKSGARWEVLEGSANDFTVRMQVSQPTRKNNPALPRTWRARALRTVTTGGKSRILLTSLAERRRFRAADIVACYNRRREIKTTYRKLKQPMLGCALTLRSRFPHPAVRNDVGRRHLAGKAAHPPTQASPTVAVRNHGKTTGAFPHPCR